MPLPCEHALAYALLSTPCAAGPTACPAPRAADAPSQLVKKCGGKHKGSSFFLTLAHLLLLRAADDGVLPLAVCLRLKLSAVLSNEEIRGHARAPGLA